MLKVGCWVHLRRESKNPSFYFLISFFNIFGLERWSSEGKSVANDSKTPDVNFAAMPLRLQYLGGDIIGSSAYGLSLIARILQFSRQSEIPDFNFHGIVEEQIAEFEIPVYNFSTVQIL